MTGHPNCLQASMVFLVRIYNIFFHTKLGFVVVVEAVEFSITFSLDPNALARDYVNNFWDTSTPICQTESLTGIYTGPDAGRVNN